jgi:NH3-dependent NAD+ synthetase
MGKGTDGIVEWLRGQLARSSARGFIFGLSGGIDSASWPRPAASPAS